MNEYLIIFLVGIVPCLIVGIWQTFVGFSVIQRARKSKTWQQAQGMLVQQEDIPVGNEVAFHLNTPLQVAYQVEGHQYYCQKVSLYENWKQKNEAIFQLQQLPAVPVYYNPQNHREAVIEKGLKPIYWLPIALGTSSLTMALMGIYFLMF